MQVDQNCVSVSFEQGILLARWLVLKMIGAILFGLLMYCEWCVQGEIKGCCGVLLFVLQTWQNLYAARTTAICDWVNWRVVLVIKVDLNTINWWYYFPKLSWCLHLSAIVSFFTEELEWSTNFFKTLVPRERYYYYLNRLWLCYI